MENQDNQRQAILYAYLAGIIDGEWTIRITHERLKKNPNWNFRYNGAISVGMTNREIVELFRSIFTPNANIHIECVPNRKLMYRWGTSGSNIVPQILKCLLPYLRVKKQQAELVIELCEDKITKRFRRNKGLPVLELRRREELYKKVKELNTTGAAATK